MKRTDKFGWLVSLAILLVIILPREMAYAQGGEKAAGERGRIEIGVRQIYGDRRSAKFNEYRDIPQGFFIRHSELSLNDLLHNTFFFTLQTRYTRNKDQSYLINLGVHRKYRLELLWDQTPHVFTTTAKSFLLESSPGVFTAPGPLRTFLQSQPTNLQALLDSARLLDMSLRRDKASGALTYTPTSDWTTQFQYSHEKQVGRRPFGTTANQFSNITELPEPINYRTDQVKVGAEYARKRWGLQATYAGSLFNNEVSTLVWDIPFLTTDAQGATSRGRLDLYPDNNAHNLSLAGAVSIPHSTRFMASIAPGWMRQNDPLLPFTINSAINTGAPFTNPCPSGSRPDDVQCLPAGSLHGAKQTLAMNYTLTSKAIPDFPLTLRYRSYDYNNNTPAITFSDWVKTDTQLVGTARKALPFAYKRKTLGLDASYEPMKNSSLKFLYEWERMDREHRDIEESNEHTVGAAFDFNPRNWVLLKASYRHSDRDIGEYEANEEGFPFGEGAETDPNGAILAFGTGPGLGQIHGLRKLDEAARGRHRAEALIQFDPADRLSLAASYGTTQDDYSKSEYGLQKDINFNYTFELTYNFHPDVSVYAEYTREKYKYRQQSRQRSPGNPTRLANDSPNNDWETDRRDLVDTWGAGLDASVPNRVIFNVFWSLSAAKNVIHTRAMGDPTLPLRDPRVPPFLITTAENYPDTSNRWHQLSTTVRFPLKGGFTPMLEYRYEKYDRVDFQLVNVGRYFINDPSTVTGIFLGVGADVPGYNAHIVSVSLEYRF